MKAIVVFCLFAFCAITLAEKPVFRAHHNLTHHAAPQFPHFNKTHFNLTHGKPALPHFNKTNVLRHTLRADEIEEDEFFAFRNHSNHHHNSSNHSHGHHNHSHHHHNSSNHSHGHHNHSHHNHSHHHNASNHSSHHHNHSHNHNRTHQKPAFPHFNKTQLLRHALRADEVEEDEFFAFRRNVSHHHHNSSNHSGHHNHSHHHNSSNHSGHHNHSHHHNSSNHSGHHNHSHHHGNRTVGKPTFPHFNKTQILRHALRADEVEEDEFFLFRRNATQAKPVVHHFAPHNLTHTNKTHHFAPHNLTKQTGHKNNTRGFLHF